MENEWPHGYHATLPDDAFICLQFTCKLRYFRSGQHAHPVSSRQDAQRAIAVPAVIEVNPKGQHLVEDVGRGVGMKHPFLHRPRTPARDFNLLPKRKIPVLVPRDEPIRIG